MRTRRHSSTELEQKQARVKAERDLLHAEDRLNEAMAHGDDAAVKAARAEWAEAQRKVHQLAVA